MASSLIEKTVYASTLGVICITGNKQFISIWPRERSKPQA